MFISSGIRFLFGRAPPLAVCNRRRAQFQGHAGANRSLDQLFGNLRSAEAAGRKGMGDVNRNWTRLQNATVSNSSSDNAPDFFRYWFLIIPTGHCRSPLERQERCVSLAYRGLELILDDLPNMGWGEAAYELNLPNGSGGWVSARHSGRLSED